MPLFGLPLLCLICCLLACSQYQEPEPEPTVLCEDHCPEHDAPQAAAEPLACNELMDCIVDCEDEACGDHCRDLATPLAILEYDDLARCKGFFCAPLPESESLEECTALLCPYENAQCLGHSPDDQLLVGQLHCDALLDCQSRCEEHTQCPQACITNATVLARRELFHLHQCLNTHCANEPIADLVHNDCANALCPSELFSCIGPPRGVASCLDIVHCTSSCSSDECRRDCFALGTSGAQESYLRLMDCTYQDCSNLHQSGVVSACHADLCEGELDACLDPQLEDDFYLP